MRKVITFILAFCLSVSAASAESISKTIRSSKINPSAISVSVRDMKDGKIVYSWHDKSPMTPASTLKLVTLMGSLDSLGSDYEFSTSLYKSVNNDLYLKLGADPFLSSSDLDTLFEAAVSKKIIEPKKIFIDDSIFDSIEWGEGWQWDDELNPLMQKFSAYNIDKNTLNIIVAPKTGLKVPYISIKPYYPINVMNLVLADANSGRNNLTVEKNTIYTPNTISISGTISSQAIVNIPVPNPRVYFKMRLDDVIRKNKIMYLKSYPRAKMPSDKIYLVKEVKHSIDEAIPEVLKNSNNFIAETLFKLAGANYTHSMGTADNSYSMLKEYLNGLNVSSEDIKFVDGSGVSKNNIMTADFMTDFLYKVSSDKNFELLKSNMPIPGEGTLKTRMLYFKDSLKAKTGTLSDTSAIAGYITTRKGKVYAFDIMVKDAKSSMSDKKDIEEQILREIYMN